jgi:hypothetical protein
MGGAFCACSLRRISAARVIDQKFGQVPGCFIDGMPVLHPDALTPGLVAGKALVIAVHKISRTT